MSLQPSNTASPVTKENDASGAAKENATVKNISEAIAVTTGNAPKNAQSTAASQAKTATGAQTEKAPQPTATPSPKRGRKPKGTSVKAKKEPTSSYKAGQATGRETGVRDILQGVVDTSVQQAKAFQDKTGAFRHESAASFARTAEVFSGVLSEALDGVSNNVSALVKSGNTATAAIRDIASELTEYSNALFSENLEASRSFFNCRNINDFYGLQIALLRSNLDSSITEAIKLTEIIIESSTEAAEPINEQINASAKRLAKALRKA